MPDNFWVEYQSPSIIRFIVDTRGLSTSFEVETGPGAVSEITSRLLEMGFEADHYDIEAAIEGA